MLLAGDSTAGKSRMAYEVIRALLPDHALINPAGRESLSAILPTAAGERRCVVWLDDLERFLGSGGLTAAMVRGLCGDDHRHVLVLATLRSVEFDRYSAREESGLGGGERDAWREARDILELATIVELPRRWSSQELEHARTYTDDPRISRALWKTDAFGLAEVLAAGPQLARDWRTAWRAGGHPRGAALVAAAVDCRRAGVHDPQPVDFLAALAEYYLEQRGGPLLRPESLDHALAWATTPSHGASSLLLPTDREGHYLAFDYLIDLDGLDGVPPAVWDALIATANPRQAWDIGESAMQRFQQHVAVRAYQKAADHNVPGADVAMAFALGYAGETRRAAQILTDALARRERDSGARDVDTLRVRHRLAEHLADGHDAVRAAEMFTALVPDLDEVLGPTHPDTLGARRWLAYSIGESGDDAEGLRLLRDTLVEHERVLGPDHHDTLLTRHYIATFTYESDPRRAIELVASVRDDYERVLGADSPRVLQTRDLLARFASWAGDLDRAVDLSRRLACDRDRILGPRHSHTLRTRFMLVRCTAQAGDRAHAAVLFDTLITDWRQVLGAEGTWTNLAARIITDGSGYGTVRTRRRLREHRDASWTCHQLLGRDHPLTQQVQRNHDAVAANGPTRAGMGP